MFTTYEQALEWIHGRLRLGIKPGLKRMEWMLSKLGNPEKKIKTVHIGGTNGKGSTLTYLRCILQEAGFTVGSFTSPFFEQFNERISYNGKPISDEEILQLVNRILPLAEELEETDLGGPTEFEVITVMAFEYFGHVQPADIALFEVGLGGRLDSTNVIEPLLSIITSIGLDHTSILGETYAEIAYEKAGIIKKDTPLITAVKEESARSVILETASKQNAEVYQLGKNLVIQEHFSTAAGEQFSLKTANNEYGQLDITMPGEHQVENASLAVMAAELLTLKGFPLEEHQIKQGLMKAYWPGRFETVSEKPLIIVDGAHNNEGIQALTNELQKRYRKLQKRVIFAALSDKKLDKMIMQLDSVADTMTFVDFDFPRAAKASDLLKISSSHRKRAASDWKDAIRSEMLSVGKNEMLIITGSLYFLSEAKPFLIKSLNSLNIDVTKTF
ncbi:bifunctional folylpolyglutamate synthase/dihydrofolate synthase [Cytobacillus gottheilii]|uniref:bifunctional folylpolyglutamate synthase/dihydrofolate synthase n=1 Tax=Cytobacillus gottheilii TaxID=859144 RepID=UPI00082C4404|nr:folylpolyglutamate synthase/dihydrofolate synthase family protein [Cytobacillus gottheilii]